MERITPTPEGLAELRALAERKVPAGVKPERYGCTCLDWGEVLGLADEVERLGKALAVVWRRFPELLSDVIPEDVADVADEATSRFGIQRRRKV